MFSSSSQVELFDFLSASPTAWHGVDAMAARLDAAGFTRLEESRAWSLEAGGRYYCVRDDGALAAFRLPAGQLTSLRMIGAHTDSPALRLKPQPVQGGHGGHQLGVEVYGGALLAPWFDRDLGIAGRVYVRTEGGRLERRLLHIDRPLAVIPSLAIHLDREANSSRSYNAQTQMAPVFALGDGDAPSIESLIQRWLAEQHGLEEADVVDFELNLCDVQPPTRSGLDGELISSARLDNLLSCWCGMEALIAADGEQGALLIANDHEEIGSGTAGGAQGTLLNDVVARLAESRGEGGAAEGRIRLLQSSRLVSCDNAHAVHPGWPDKHDAQHRPRLNGGPVIKVNASQRYATSAATGALFRDICRHADVPVQTFVSRADMPCGSTIGPLSATRSGVPTLDIGIAQWAMHSIRETAGAHDPDYLKRALTAFCNRDLLD
ncbi:M18 family aminopeptidase [Kushneria aurantia]|uniref:M18 family aminopeptidase n=1 Tax=Kushneria aurantia TaxID=504092 RepID=A0ABV6G3N2_9GAMM|nr:M18 family aminopeptidase [Kushneria aurantia]